MKVSAMARAASSSFYTIYGRSWLEISGEYCPFTEGKLTLGLRAGRRLMTILLSFNVDRIAFRRAHLDQWLQSTVFACIEGIASREMIGVYVVPRFHKVSTS